MYIQYFLNFVGKNSEFLFKPKYRFLFKTADPNLALSS